MNNDLAFLEVQGLIKGKLFLKIEALNPAGSIKLKAAVGMIDALEREGRIGRGSKLIESSSGNLGVALAAVCAERGYAFTCVIDPNTSEQNRKTIEALGSKVVVVRERDANGGYLATRIRYIEDVVANDPSTIWLNQYANLANPAAHHDTTARSIAETFERIDYLFIGAGTTGTLMGCKSFFRVHRPATKIIAVDSIGSVTFGYPPSPRFIPGLGTSRRPEIFEPEGIFALERVEESEAVRLCRWLARSRGLLAGGSTGTVLAALRSWSDRIPQDAVAVAISPDLGERYLDTIYSDDWVREKFGDGPLGDDLQKMQSAALEIA
ncbi:MAG: 2,3-diaminopropionate biosynthesis protein SbnA [Paracoccus sp. (in: a-proteobacteria)]|uniref:2,3-diaminopropionate biosynthesis protein SbnA n=1 Tax=Paracoccus sp. TaxID=267 RepID=UPI0026DF9684|nr:2,3-diaminopropionate biosynthesis protein SbnA [Paracoccus sp. (in: a-proteobacteria)]MDO5622901.1 2,3-diaminopropionate biosynthesis protein SbnA [Paracoccus sp. (in: a-proteobacteria)]